MRKFVSQGALTLVAKVKPDQVKKLRELLAKMVYPLSDVEKNVIVPFIKITTIHFARFVVVEKSLSENGTLRSIDPILVFATNYDGRESAHIEEIVAASANGIDDIYSHCLDYPEQGKRDHASRISYLRGLRKPYGAFHCGTPGMSVARINSEGELREEIEKYIDKKRSDADWVAKDPVQIREDIRNFCRNNEFNWALTSPSKPPLSWKLFRRNGWKTVLGLSIKIPFLIVLFPIFVLILRYKERRDKIYQKIRYDEHAKTLAALEDKVVQNQMTNLVDMKPGIFRKVALNLFISLIELFARYKFTKGKLGSIPTIHFARWLHVDNGNALLFFSNYGSSWESYLGDFVDKASKGLTGIWSNTVLFPRTKGLTGAGATDEERFKCWARKQQMRTDVWYSAYKSLTVKNILMNKEIRKGLAADSLSKRQTLEWLKLL